MGGHCVQFIIVAHVQACAYTDVHTVEPKYFEG